VGWVGQILALHSSTQDIHFFSRPLPRERATFVSAKVAKTIGAGHDGFSDVVSLKLPCASRRARASANSQIHVLRQSRFSRAPGRDARHQATAPSSLPRPSMACSSSARERIACTLAPTKRQP
ncbi:MAG: hypothetical protein ACTHMO_02885, partial [Rhodanobacteraceae bacterium]